MSTRPWFVRRSIGVGWRPATWQGWLITAAAAAVALAALITARAEKAPIFIVVVVGVAVLYSVVAMLTARPRAVTGSPSTAAPLQVRPAAAATVPRVVEDRPPPPSDGRQALVVSGLTKQFGARVAFAEVSFSVGAGEVFGFLGPNGAGKTTTVRTLGTLLTPSAGSATVAGIPLTPRNGQAIRQRISIMPESPGLYLRLSVRENLEFFAGLFTIAEPRTRIGEALQAVNLVSRAEDLCGSLSKGLRQRVGLARALLNDPEILFLDEPTSGLDPVATREVHELIDGLRRRGVTVFLTTHRLEEAERLCDRVAILNTTLRMVGRPDELRRTLFSRSLVVATAAPVPGADRLFTSLDGVERWERDDSGRYVLTVSDPRAVAPALTRALVAAGVDVESIGEVQHSLEDVYMELISADVEAAAS
jgi:ABC-2 type transport system ATP-binding protein